LFNPHPSNN